MEKLLGFFTSKPVSIVENDNFFKKAFKFIFVFAAAVIAIYGIYNIISVAIDYFDYVFDLDAFPIIRHLLLFLLCFIIVAITYLFVIGALYHRSKLILNDPNNIIDIMPGVFKTFGIIGAIVPVSIGLMGFLSALLAADPFIPMDGLIGVISRISIVDLPAAIFGYGVDSFKEYIDQLFNSGLVVLIVSIFVAFANLVGMYLISALYKLGVDFWRK